MTDASRADTALLLMDLQPGILANYGDADYLPRIRRALAATRHAGLPVIWVRVAFRDGYPEVSADNAIFAGIRGSGRLLESTDAAGIHPDLAVQPQDVIVTKRRISAFAGSDLDVVLRGGGIRHLVLAGVSTSGVVLSTVRLAADLDYRLTVLADGCMDGDADVHRVLTEKVFPRQATVRTIDDWAARLAA
ncbi:MAG: cysteine hydrolase [Xanthomonadaceae bacterium]|nr:cysteine hydrolase [Xanthomonadaceae bacterium]MDE1963734.1 cysteine hydrolase [Xanthomonadaceae bacterium]